MVLIFDVLVYFFKHMFRCGVEYIGYVKQMFIEKFLETDVPHRGAIRKMISKYRETGSVKDTKPSRPQILIEDKLLDISNRIAQSPKKSAERMVQQTSVSKHH